MSFPASRGGRKRALSRRINEKSNSNKRGKFGASGGDDRIEEEDRFLLLSSDNNNNNNDNANDNDNNNTMEEQIRLEEEILLLEQSMEILNKRKRSIDSQLVVCQHRRDDIMQTLATQTERKYHLDQSQVKHKNLLQELQKSLSKSHEILLRLNGENGGGGGGDLLAEAENAQLMQEIRRQEERTTTQQMEQQQAEEEEEQEVGDEQRLKIWLFLENENLDWLLALQSIEDNNNLYEIEQIFVRGDGKLSVLDRVLELQQNTTIAVKSWPPNREEEERLFREQTISRNVIALANFSMDSDFLHTHHEIQWMISTVKPPNITNHRYEQLEVSHQSVGGVTSTHQSIFVHELCASKDDTSQHANDLQKYLQYFDEEPRTIQSILEMDNNTEYQFEIASNFPTTIDALSTVLNDQEEDGEKRPIYHSGGLLPPIPIPEETLIGYPHTEGIWRVRPLTREEVWKAYDVDTGHTHEGELVTIADYFVPLRILQASLEAVVKVVVQQQKQQQEVLPDYYSCPITPVHQDDKSLSEFWQGHCQTANPHCLMSFTPCLGETTILKRIMDINATEALMQDVACGSNFEAAAVARRQTLRNTCLDFVLMMGGTTDTVEVTAGNSTSGKETETPTTTTIEETNRNYDDCDDIDDDVSESEGVNVAGSDFHSKSESQRTDVDPNVALCPYELSGVCADPYCPYQHLAAKRNRPKIVPREVLPLPLLKLPEDPAQCNNKEMDGEEDADEADQGVESVNEEDDNQSDGATQTQNGGADADPNKMPTDQDLEIESNGQSSPTEKGGVSDEFESNLDFVALGDAEGDLGGGEENEDFISLETAGLVGWGHHASQTQEPKDDFSGFWWQTSSTIPSKHLGFEDWLRLLGDFHVLRVDEDDTASLEYQGPSPSNSQELCAFAARMVDCARLMVHAGRFDLTEPLCTIARNVLKGAVAGDVHTKEMEGFLQEVEVATSTLLESAYCNQNGFRTTFRCQLILAMVSDFLLGVYEKLSADGEEAEEIDWAQCMQHIEGLSNLLSNGSEGSRLDDEDHHQTTWYIHESIKVALFRKEPLQSNRSLSNSKSDGRPENWVALLEDTRKASAFAKVLRLKFSLMSAAEDFLKPIWSLVKSCLHQHKGTRSSQSSSCLRCFIYICSILQGVLEGSVDYLKQFDGDPLNSLSFSTLVQLDGTAHGILKSLNNMIADNIEMPLFDLLLAPLMAASISFSSYLGFYTKAQHRLEEALSNASAAGFMPYSELLWSQLLHLRSSLPFRQQATGNKRGHALTSKKLLTASLSDSHQQIVDKVALYGVHLHHLCQPGDWAVLARFNQCLIEQSHSETKNAARLKQHLFSLLRQGVSVGLQTGTMVQAPASLRRVAQPSECAEFIADFPRSLLVFGHILKYLNLAWCQLRHLPESFGLHTPNLKNLDLSCNNLENLPDSFGMLESLDTFIANDNMLLVLPDSFVNLSCLRKLQLCDNNLHSFPSVLRTLKQLEELHLSGNKFEMVDSAQLALLLPKLRVFVAPELEREIPLEEQPTPQQPRLKHLPRINAKLAAPLTTFWRSMTRAEREKSLTCILQKASSSSEACTKVLGLTASHCPSFFIKGICLLRSCSLQHTSEDVDDEAAKEVRTLLEKGYQFDWDGK